MSVVDGARKAEDSPSSSSYGFVTRTCDREVTIHNNLNAMRTEVGVATKKNPEQGTRSGLFGVRCLKR